MIELHDEPLSKHTTIHIGGLAETYLIPESLDELVSVIKRYQPKFFIGGGSNLLIADRKYDLVVDLNRFNNDFSDLGSGRIKVGASLRLQSLINQINGIGYGGIEYLYSVPGLVGGAVAMNAGRGKRYNQTISDYIEMIRFLRAGEIFEIKKEDCNFSYRNSSFKNTNDIIIECIFAFPQMSREEAQMRKQERMQLCHDTQDTSKPNFGSVFSEFNPSIMNFVKKHQIGGKVHFSGKTSNWIVNENGNYYDALSTIKKVELIHKLLGKRCKREVIVWE